MSRLADAIMAGGYARNISQPMLDLKYGGMNGWVPNLAELSSNQAYVSSPMICILLEAPKLFTVMPESQKWISSLKAMFELHAKTIDGMNATLTVDTDTHPVGGAGEQQYEIVNVTREASKPKFGFTEKYGRPIQTLLEYWIRYGMMDPDTKYALLGTLNNPNVKDLLLDWSAATCLFIVPDRLHRVVDKAWITTGMMPTSTGDITGKRDLTGSQEILTLDVEFTGTSQYGLGVNQIAQNILNTINTQNSDPYMRAGFINKVSPDVDAVNTNGYRSVVETVGRTSVTNMSR